MGALVLGAFASPERLLRAAAELRAAQVGKLDAHTPYPVEGLDVALGLSRSVVPRLAFLGGLAGALTAYGFQYYTAAVAYPLRVGGRPAHAGLAFVPIGFELMVLFASAAIVLGLLLLWRLPRPHHPVFEVEAFRSASLDRFWVSVLVAKEGAAEEVAQRLRLMGAQPVEVVPEERP
ncbi:MAG: DUF3341 domain-containing protein [Myxococcota bacterium]